MKRTMVFGAVVGTVCLSVCALPTESPYRGIPERNVFGLTPEPPPKIVEQPLPPQAKVLLAGLSTIGGFKRVFLKIQYPAQPGHPAKEESLMLAEGQAEGGLEVVTIDDKAKEISVKYEGNPMILTFDKDGIKGPSGTPTSPQGPGAPTVVANQGPGAIPSAPPQANPPGNAAAAQIRAGILRRSLRLPTAPTTTVAPPPSPAAFGAPAARAQDLTDKTAQKLTPEEEQILRELENGQAPQ